MVQIHAHAHTLLGHFCVGGSSKVIWIAPAGSCPVYMRCVRVCEMVGAPTRLTPSQPLD